LFRIYSAQPRSSLRHHVIKGFYPTTPQAVHT
jgi:hypothetical protein